VRLDDDLLTAAKRRAAAQQTTLTALIEDSLRRKLEESPDRPFEARPVNPGEEGVDPRDSASLRGLMDHLLR
jgi:hypothetical protein